MHGCIIDEVRAAGAPRGGRAPHPRAGVGLAAGRGVRRGPGVARHPAQHLRQRRALLKGLRVEPVTAELGRAAVELLGRTRRKDTVDAIVVATAAALPRAVIVTSDPRDIGALADEVGGVRVEVV